jgi:hypothetical protein
MPTGPGKYDDLCTYVREQSNARAACVIVWGGNKGHGFACQITDPAMIQSLPEMLEDIARQMKASKFREKGIQP